MKTILRLSLITGLFVLVCSTGYGEQVNPNKLPLCPKDQNARHHNCWGTYTYRSGNKYVGEFMDDKMHGRGTYTRTNGEKYMGDFKDNVNHGQGTYTNINGEKYVGEFKDGKYHGQGTITFAVGDKYVGEHKDGKMHGQGTYTFAQGHGYQGQWIDGKPHGKGRQTYADGRQPDEGVFENGKFVRAEKISLPNPNIATNTARRNSDLERILQQVVEEPRQIKEEIRKDNGNKNEITSNSSNSEPVVKIEKNKSERDREDPNNPNDLPPCPVGKMSDVIERHVSGFYCWGSVTFANGDKYVGEFKDGKKHGVGAYFHLEERSRSSNGYPKGDKYVGEYKDDQRNGQGTHTFANGNQYVGEWKSDKRTGQGTFTFANGNKYVGEFKGFLYHGQGILTTADGQRFEGVWEGGNFIRESKVNLPNPTNNIATTTDRSDIGAQRKKLEEERRKFEDEKRTREQQRKNQRVNLQVTHTQPAADGSFTINVQTNTDTASLLVNGSEEGGRLDGSYSIKRIARAGQDTKFDIKAKDIYGNTETKTITVSRSIADSTPQFAELDPSKVKTRSKSDAVAIIIGIQNYRRVPKAEYANDDARVFYDYAIRALGIRPENIKLLIDDQADEIEILDAFQNWLPLKVKKTKTDVYVFYSGHGLPSEDGKSLYILPFGADKQFIDRTAINQQEIIRFLQSVQAKSVTMFMDACYSGQIRTGDTLIASARPVSLKTSNNLFPPEFTVFSASSPDQIASSSPALKHGIFSYYVMKGMEGDADENKDGQITIDELHAYLAEMVGKQALSLNRKQSPQLIGTSGKILIYR